MDVVEILDQLKSFIEHQVHLEETDPNLDWIHAHDSAFRWIERLDDEGIEASEPVFLFLEETLHRRNESFGMIRRKQIKEAIKSGRAFPKKN